MTDIQQIFKHTQFVNDQHKTVALLSHLGVLLEKRVEDFLETYDLPINKYRILRGLKTVYPKGVGVYKLNDFLVDRKADISRLVESMVVRGLVVRAADPANKSVTQVIITPQAIQLIDDINRSIPQVLEPFMFMSADETKQLNKMLERVRDAVASTANKTQTR